MSLKNIDSCVILIKKWKDGLAMSDKFKKYITYFNINTILNRLENEINEDYDKLCNDKVITVESACRGKISAKYAKILFDLISDAKNSDNITSCKTLQKVVQTFGSVKTIQTPKVLTTAELNKKMQYYTILKVPFLDPTDNKKIYLDLPTSVQQHLDLLYAKYINQKNNSTSEVENNI